MYIALSEWARYDIEIEPQVRAWLNSLSDHDYGRAEFYADLLADDAKTLGEPYSRHLGGKVRELRFHLRRRQVRITYWLAPGRRVILLTVFYKTRRSEVAEVERARAHGAEGMPGRPRPRGRCL